MNQEEIKTEIKQYKEIVEVMEYKLKFFQARLDATKAQLADAEKPELRHLDFGEKAGVRWIKIDAGVWWLYEDGHAAPSLLSDSEFLDSVKGNLNDIFDENEVLSNPLREFMTDVHCYRIDSEDYPDAPICMAGKHHSIAEVKEHILNLRCLVRTAELEAANE